MNIKYVLGVIENLTKANFLKLNILTSLIFMHEKCILLYFSTSVKFLDCSSNSDAMAL